MHVGKRTSADCPFEARLSGKGGVVRWWRDPEGMGARFIGVDRDQVFLMPPSVRDWVPEDHLVWTVLDTVGELDLSAFYAVFRVDGHGRPAYEPSMMVALLLYAYARGNRSSRGIERACFEDVALTAPGLLETKFIGLVILECVLPRTALARVCRRQNASARC